MILNIQKLESLTEFSLEVEGQACNLPPEIGKFTSPIALDIQIRKVGEEITINGSVSARIEMKCARCLQPHTEYLDETFEVIYYPKPDDQDWADEIELEETDLNVCYYEGNTLSIFELLRQQLLLMIPIKPLCKPDCAGLCPSCGKNLNVDSCHCTQATIDPRLAVLQQLLNSETPIK